LWRAENRLPRFSVSLSYSKAPMKIRKAVFPVAGLGTRVLPATKAMPRRCLTIVDKPLIQYVVDETKEAGIEHSSSSPAQQGRDRGSFRPHVRARHHARRARQQEAEQEILARDQPEAGRHEFYTTAGPVWGSVTPLVRALTSWRRALRGAAPDELVLHTPAARADRVRSSALICTASGSAGSGATSARGSRACANTSSSGSSTAKARRPRCRARTRRRDRPQRGRCRVKLMAPASGWFARQNLLLGLSVGRARERGVELEHAVEIESSIRPVRR